MKRTPIITAVLFTISLCILTLGHVGNLGSLKVNAEQIEQNDITYTIDETTKEATVDYFYTDSDEFSIPETIDVDGVSYTVTKLGNGEDAVVWGDSYSKVDLPATIREISDNSFYEVTFPTTIKLPAHLEKIGYRAFFRAKGLQTLTVSGSVKIIGKSAFEGGDLEAIHFAEGLQTIGDSAFSNNKLTGEIKLPESLQSAGDSMFASNRLDKLHFPKHMTIAASGALAENQLTSIDFIGEQAQITALGDRFFALNPLSEVVTLPKNIEKLGDTVFYGIAHNNSNQMKEFNVTNRLKQAGESVFYGQPLAYINVPNQQADDLKAVFANSMANVEAATIIRDEESSYSLGTLRNYEVEEGSAVTLQALSRDKYQFNLGTQQWEGINPAAEWYHNGKKLTETTGKLELSAINEQKTGIYYAVVDGQRLADITVSLKALEGDVHVRYQDEDGNELAATTTMSGKVGENYQAEPKTISGWEVKTTPDNTNGTFTEAAQTVTFVYQKAAGAPVTVQYVDENGNELAASEILSGILGESYQAAEKELDGWELIEQPDNASGTFTEQGQTVTFVYQKTAETGNNDENTEEQVDPATPEDTEEPAIDKPITAGESDLLAPNEEAATPDGAETIIEQSTTQKGKQPAEGSSNIKTENLALKTSTTFFKQQPQTEQPQKQAANSKNVSDLPKTGDQFGLLATILGMLCLFGAVYLRKKKQQPKK